MMKHFSPSVAILVGVVTLSSSFISPSTFVSAQCGNKNACISRWYGLSTSVTWNLCSLCRDAGNEYNYTDAYNHTYYYNFGASVQGQKCVPPWTVYQSTGMAVQFWTPAPPCPSPPDGTCRDPENGNNPVCCSGDCALLGVLDSGPIPATPMFNSSGNIIGLSIAYGPMPVDASDPFSCPTDPTSGCSKSRQLTINLYCDPMGSKSNVTFIAINEPSSCSYVLEASSKAACGKFAALTEDEQDEL